MMRNAISEQMKAHYMRRAKNFSLQRDYRSLLNVRLKKIQSYIRIQVHCIIINITNADIGRWMRGNFSIDYLANYNYGKGKK